MTALRAVPSRVWAVVAALVVLASLALVAVVGIGLHTWSGTVAGSSGQLPHLGPGLALGQPPRSGVVTVPADHQRVGDEGTAPVPTGTVPPVTAAAPPPSSAASAPTPPARVARHGGPGPATPPAVNPPATTPPVSTPPVVAPPVVAPTRPGAPAVAPDDTATSGHGLARGHVRTHADAGPPGPGHGAAGLPPGLARRTGGHGAPARTDGGAADPEHGHGTPPSVGHRPGGPHRWRPAPDRAHGHEQAHGHEHGGGHGWGYGQRRS